MRCIVVARILTIQLIFIYSENQWTSFKYSLHNIYTICMNLNMFSLYTDYKHITSHIIWKKKYEIRNQVEKMRKYMHLNGDILQRNDLFRWVVDYCFDNFIVTTKDMRFSGYWIESFCIRCKRNGTTFMWCMYIII